MTPPPPPLRPGQIKAIHHLWAYADGAALYLNVGFGKSRVVLSALEDWMLPALVISPPNVARYTWPEETSKWRPDLTYAWAGPTPAKRQAALNGTADIVFVSSSALWDRRAKRAITAERFRTVVVDESHKIKDSSTVTFRAVKHITGRVGKNSRKNLWLLTGTPTPTSMEDLWGPQWLMDGGAALGRTLADFRARYFREYTDEMFVGRPGQKRPVNLTRYEIRPGAEVAIRHAIKERCLSLGSEVTMPAVTTNIVEVPLSREMRKLMQALKKEHAVEFDDGTALTSASSGVVAFQLLQLANGVVKNNYEEVLLGAPALREFNTDKLDRLEMLVDSLAGDPLLVVYAFTADRDRILKRFDGRAFTKDDPDWKARWDRGELPILVVHAAALGAGLNLQSGGANLAWFTPTFSAGDDEQMLGRLNRPGQTRPVVVTRFETPIDKAARLAMETRADAQNALLEYLKSQA